MTKGFPVLQTLVFIGAASLFGIGMILWNQGRVAVQLTVADPAALVVEKPGNFHLIPVRLVNDGHSDILIVGFYGY